MSNRNRHLVATKTKEYLAKKNQDGSYSLSLPASDLTEICFVDFYNEASGEGYQRLETLRERRGREVEDYLKRCKENSVPPRLFEMTANARVRGPGSIVNHSFEALDDSGILGFLRFECHEGQWLSMIDGGTRLLGIQKALVTGVIPDHGRFDVRIFIGLSVPEEIAMFLLINERQKRVRTDLGVRVVQGLLDAGRLSDAETKTLETVVPETDAWRYEASRIAARLNSEADSPWRGLIQMPNDSITRPVKLQALWSSLDWLLTDPDIKTKLEVLEAQGLLQVDAKPATKTDFLVKVLKNFWTAVRQVNPKTFDEPMTNVLLGSIGVSGCHMALSKLLPTMLDGSTKLDVDTFSLMVKDSEVADYVFWFNKPGSLPAESYPSDKGEATTMIGHSGYLRLHKILEKGWRSTLHSSSTRPMPVSA